MAIEVAKVREFKGHAQAIYTLVGIAGSGVFYSSGADGMVVQWQTEEADGHLFAKFDFPIYSLHIAGNVLLCGGNNGTLSIFDTGTKDLVKQINVHRSAIFDIVSFNNGFLLALDNGMLVVIDNNFDTQKELQLSTASLRKLLVVNNEIYVTGTEGIIWQLNAEFEIVKQKSAESLTIFALAYQYEKNTLLSGGRNATLKFWHNLEETNSINAHWYHIKDIAFNQSQQYFTTCSMDKTIKLWSGQNFELLKVIDFEKNEAHQSSVNKILWIGINRFISCSDDRTLMCFEIKE